MRLEPMQSGFQIDAADLGPLLGVPPEEVHRLIRDARISTLCEEGRDEDAGRYRVTFRHRGTRVRLTVNDAGEVLLRTRTTVFPHPDARTDAADWA